MTISRLIALAVLGLCLSASAQASDLLPLPQSLSDLQPVAAAPAPLPPVNGVHIAIPGDRQLPAMAKAPDVLRLAPGKSKTVKLEHDAASVIISNPAHATVFLDSARLLVVVPRAPGATSFTVLDQQGKTLLTQAVMVSERDDEDYVRVTRICGADNPNCVASTTYFCPDNCAPVSVPGVENNAAYPTIPPVAGLTPVPSLPVASNDTAQPLTTAPNPPTEMVMPSSAEGVN